MSEVIAVMNQKGGCGKTTTVVNTATSLAVMGKSVLVVDMDPQANATTSFGIDKTKIENTIYDALMGDISIKKATIPTFIKNLFIIPSNISLSGAGMELSKRDNYHIVLKDTLKDVVPLFDYIFIDLPPSLGVITVNALVASDSVLIPIQAEYYALEGVADLINTIKLVEKRLRSPTPIKGILLTLFDKRTRLSKDVHRELKNFGKPCLIYDPDSTGTKAYLKLAKEIIQRDENVHLSVAKKNLDLKAKSQFQMIQRNLERKTGGK